MGKTIAALVGGAMLAFPMVANAGAIYDDLSDFSFNSFSQGLGACQFGAGCNAVAGDRTGLGKAFDGSVAAGGFHSLGVYGLATFGVAPGQSITDVLTLEATFSGNGGPSWPEKLGLFFSNTVNAGGITSWSADLAADVGAISNPNVADYAGGAGASRAAVDGSDLASLLRSNVLSDGVLGAIFTTDENAGFDIDTATGVSVVGSDIGSGGWQFDIDVDGSDFGEYRYLTLVDLTMSDDPNFWQSTRGDGWDLAELRVEADDVPEPATAVLLGVGLLGMSVARRRRAA